MRKPWRETLAAAEDLAKQKHDLEREIEKVKIDIAYRERAVTDEHLVAKNLLDFEKTIASVSFDEQCELLRLMLRQVRVNRIDPNKEPIPGNPHTWSTQIRTQWFAVNFDLYAIDLFSMSCENATSGSHSGGSGGGSGIIGFPDLFARGARFESNGVRTRPVNQKTTAPLRWGRGLLMAEGVGFEPTVGCPTLDFEFP